MTASTQPERYDEIFVVEPPNVEFNAYEIGETYELKLTIRNKSALSRRLRVLPPPSRHFSVTEMRWPSQHGMLAPGMSCSCSVRFKPDSLADYEDSLTVLSEVMKFELDLAARRHPQAHPRRRHRRRPRPRGQRRGIPSAVQERRRPGSIPRGGRRGLARARHPLALPNLDAALEPGESPEDDPTPCVRLAPFRVGPGVMDLAPMQWEKLRVGFAPPGPGEFTREFRLVCDNCQVRTFAVRGRGAGARRRRDPHRLARRRPENSPTTRCGSGTTSSPVASRRDVPRYETPRRFRYRSNGNTRPRRVCLSSRPRRGRWRRAPETEFVATFAPREVASYERRFKLLVDCAFPPREPLNGAAMFERPVEVESVLVAGAGRARDVVVDANLVNFAGALLPGRHYDREIRLTNRGDAACAAWRGQG